MPDLETGKTTDHETHHGLRGASGGGGAADPPSAAGMDWWNTPASLIQKPVAVDPAIYGIDASDVGGDVGSLDAYVGISGHASAQAGSAPLTRADHIRSAEGGRAGTMSAQLMLAARKIEASVQKIRDTLQTPVGERSADGVLDHLESLVAEAVRARDQIMFVTHEQQRSALKVAPVQEGILHVDRASHELNDVVLRVKDFASRHKLPFDSDKVTGKGVKDSVDRLQGAMKTQVESSHTEPVEESEKSLQLESLEQSLDALDHASQALSLAVNEATPDEKIKEVLPSFHSARRMLQQSLVEGLRPTKDMLDMGIRIRFAVKKAWTDARPFGLQSDVTFKQAYEDTLPAIDKLESLGKGKKK